MTANDHECWVREGTLADVLEFIDDIVFGGTLEWWDKLQMSNKIVQTRDGLHTVSYSTRTKIVRCDGKAVEL